MEEGDRSKGNRRPERGMDFTSQKQAPGFRKAGRFIIF